MDLVSHAAMYFKECKEDRDRKRRKNAEEKLAAYGVHLSSRISHDIVDDEALWIEISKERRKAIAALAVNPRSHNEEATYVEKNPEQMQLLKIACEEVSFLKHCTEEQKSMLINAMFKRTVSKGERIVTQGDEGDNFYLIGKGDFVFHIEFGNCCIRKRMSGKGSFGELAHSMTAQEQPLFKQLLMEFCGVCVKNNSSQLLSMNQLRNKTNLRKCLRIQSHYQC